MHCRTWPKEDPPLMIYNQTMVNLAGVAGEVRLHNSSEMVGSGVVMGIDSGKWKSLST